MAVAGRADNGMAHHTMQYSHYASCNKQGNSERVAMVGEKEFRFFSSSAWYYTGGLLVLEGVLVHPRLPIITIHGQRHVSWLPCSGSRSERIIPYYLGSIVYMTFEPNKSALNQRWAARTDTCEGRLSKQITYPQGSILNTNQLAIISLVSFVPKDLN
jgi:hypothetical protein